jgi:hypothetical protein
MTEQFLACPGILSEETGKLRLLQAIDRSFEEGERVRFHICQLLIHNNTLSWLARFPSLHLWRDEWARC